MLNRRTTGAMGGTRWAALALVIMLGGCNTTPRKPITEQDKDQFLSTLVSYVERDEIYKSRDIVKALDLRLELRYQRKESGGMEFRDYRISDPISRGRRFTIGSSFSSTSNDEVVLEPRWSFDLTEAFCITKDDLAKIETSLPIHNYDIQYSVSNGDNSMYVSFKKGQRCADSVRVYGASPKKR